MTKAEAVPELSVLISNARKIVSEARRQNKLDSLTVNEVKKQLEHDFSLKEGTLNDAPYKKAIGTAVREAAYNDPVQPKKDLEESGINKEEETKKNELKVVNEDAKGIEKKSVPSNIESSRPLAKRTAKMPRPEDRGRRDFALNIPKAASKKTEDIKPKSAKAPKSEYKSREYIEDNDEVDSAITDSSGNGDKPSSDEGSSSESDRDKKRKRRNSEEKGSRKRPKAAARESEVPEGDEATIKKYKTLVAACGARKKWAKELANYPEPKQQIRRLKEILAELGMKGRYSMEKAKQIKRKRALARELEDVIEFERKAGVSRDRRKKRSGRPIGELDTETESESDGSEEKELQQPASTAIKRYMKKKRVDDDDDDDD